MSKRIALIDGDEIAYKAAFTIQHSYYVVKDDHKTLWKVKTKQDAIESIGDCDLDLSIEKEVSPKGNIKDGYKKIENIISKILYNTNSDDYIIYLTGENNFRKELATILEYKGKRSSKPIFLEDIREYLRHRGAITVSYLEADDCLSAKYQELDNAVICTQDKDLRTVPSLNYNPTTNKISDISEREAIFNFYHQLITGDATDNIPGIKGLGKIRATKLLEPLYDEDASESEYYNLILELYSDSPYITETRSREDVVYEIANLLYMHRTFDKEERWNAPKKEEKG
jgi:hypothetical protein